VNNGFFEILLASTEVSVLFTCLLRPVFLSLFLDWSFGGFDLDYDIFKESTTIAETTIPFFSLGR
jgi:hypothetical protein